ncbi:8151_t:CDS:1, partial [Racocetra fulgida]
ASTQNNKPRKNQESLKAIKVFTDQNHVKSTRNTSSKIYGNLIYKAGQDKDKPYSNKISIRI